MAVVVDFSTAIQAIEQLNPDVIFLDIQMPGESDFDLLNKIKVEAKVIFVTAFDEYAIRAFEVNALDYLLNPVNPDRLVHTIKRLEQEEVAKSIPQRVPFKIKNIVFFDYFYYIPGATKQWKNYSRVVIVAININPYFNDRFFLLFRLYWCYEKQNCRTQNHFLYPSIFINPTSFFYRPNNK